MTRSASNTPKILDGRFELGPLLAIQGDDGVYRCPYCGKPCSYVGHKRCVESDPREVGR